MYAGSTGREASVTASTVPAPTTVSVRSRRSATRKSATQLRRCGAASSASTLSPPAPSDQRSLAKRPRTSAFQ